MANNDNTNDPNEFENLYSSTDETAPERRNRDAADGDIVDAPYSASDDLSGFNDLDDGSDEDGIFAAPQNETKRPKKSSSTGLLAAVAFLAVAGAGGYFYLSDPAAIEKIKHNLTGSVAGEDVTLPSFQMGEVAATTAPTDSGAAPVPAPSPSPDDVNSAGTGASPSPLDGADMPPQPEPIADASSNSGSVPTPTSAPAPVAEANVAPSPDAPAPAAVPPLTPADVAVPSPDVVQPIAANDVPPPVDQAVAPVPADTAPAVPPSDAGLPPPTETVAAPPPADAPVVSTPKVENAKIFKPKPIEDKGPTLLNDEGVDPTKVNVSDSGPVDGSATPAENAADMKIAEEKEQATKYFDAPPGDIMSRLPAPSMDPKRGKTESLIIVNSNSKTKPKPPKSPSHASSSMNQKVVIETTSLESKIVSANRALKLARYDAARQMYDELYSLNPREPRVLMGRAVLFQKLGENDRAISTYEELLAINPNNAEAVVNLSGLVTKQMPAVALEKLLSLRARYPDNPAIAAQLGVAYANTGNLEDAYRYLSLASSMEPNNAQHYFNLAVISEKAGNYARAVDFYEKSLEVDATSSGASAVSRDMIYDRLTRLRGN